MPTYPNTLSRDVTRSFGWPKVLLENSEQLTTASYRYYCVLPTQTFSFAEFRSSAPRTSMRWWSVQLIGIAGIALATNTTNTTNTTTPSDGNCTALEFPACQDCNSCEEAFECAGVACLQDGNPSMLECEYSEERQWYLVCTSQISQAHAKLLLIAPLIFCLCWISWGARAP